jgi:hypothetical protein
MMARPDQLDHATVKARPGLNVMGRLNISRKTIRLYSIAFASTFLRMLNDDGSGKSPRRAERNIL